MDDYSNLSVAETLCSIGALCQVCGVTRRMVLNYEEHGLIRPISVSRDSGYRYYGAQSVARIRHIKSLQKLGLSLSEIGQFMDGDRDNLQSHLDRLKAMRQALDQQINRTEALLTPLGEFTIHRARLPAGDYVITTERSETSQDRFLLLWRFTAYILKKGWQVSDTTGLCCILHTSPDSPKAGMCSAAWSVREPNEESVYFPERDALCVNVRGPYSLVPEAIGRLRQYAREHGLPSDGDIRMAYLTSPQSHVSPESYVTQVFLEL